MGLYLCVTSSQGQQMDKGYAVLQPLETWRYAHAFSAPSTRRWIAWRARQGSNLQPDRYEGPAPNSELKASAVGHRDCLNERPIQWQPTTDGREKGCHSARPLFGVRLFARFRELDAAKM